MPAQTAGRDRVRVGVVGFGALGRGVVDRLWHGVVPRAELVGVVNRSPVSGSPVPRWSLAQAVESCDLLIECAGQDAVRETLEAVAGLERTVVVTSVGALLDPELRDRRGSAERVVPTHGAIGGLDILQSAALAHPFDRVQVSSSKLPASVLRPWMSPRRQEAIRQCAEPVLVFEGGVDEAARLFPASLNVAAAVALAVQDPDVVEVRLWADPGAVRTVHRIVASGPVGDYDVRCENVPSADNPRSSAVVVHSVLRTVSTLV
ncbi:aspartate dehydrogenase domain-containing protein [Kocuria sp. M1R5S2]|uniref:aspartate dehydrogenase domain-containing protein n=1 Tax=Kocuria rhizosphaerae TaxID=3376285 RepID=UPI0037A6913B